MQIFVVVFWLKFNIDFGSFDIDIVMVTFIYIVSMMSHNVEFMTSVLANSMQNQWNSIQNQYWIYVDASML